MININLIIIQINLDGLYSLPFPSFTDVPLAKRQLCKSSMLLECSECIVTEKERGLHKKFDCYAFYL